MQELGEKIRKIGHEFGVTTGRPRRCGWFDVVVAKYSAMINGFDRCVHNVCLSIITLSNVITFLLFYVAFA